MNIFLIVFIDINICSDSEIYENENTFTASQAMPHKLQTAKLHATKSRFFCRCNSTRSLVPNKSPTKYDEIWQLAWHQLLEFSKRYSMVPYRLCCSPALTRKARSNTACHQCRQPVLCTSDAIRSFLRLCPASVDSYPVRGCYAGQRTHRHNDSDAFYSFCGKCLCGLF